MLNIYVYIVMKKIECTFTYV